MNVNSIVSAGSASDFLAAERTYLAWTRTVLSLVGFGLAFSKIGGADRSVQWVALSTVLLGTVFLITSTCRYFDLMHMLEHKEFVPDRHGVWIASASTGLMILASLASILHKHKQERREAKAGAGQELRHATADLADGLLPPRSELDSDSGRARRESDSSLSGLLATEAIVS